MLFLWTAWLGGFIVCILDAVLTCRGLWIISSLWSFVIVRWWACKRVGRINTSHAKPSAKDQSYSAKICWQPGEALFSAVWISLASGAELSNYISAITNMAIFPPTYLQERISLETSRLYRQAGVNPLAGNILADQQRLHFPFLFSLFRQLGVISWYITTWSSEVGLAVLNWNTGHSYLGGLSYIF